MKPLSKIFTTALVLIMISSAEKAFCSDVNIIFRQSSQSTTKIAISILCDVAKPITVSSCDGADLYRWPSNIDISYAMDDKEILKDFWIYLAEFSTYANRRLSESMGLSGALKIVLGSRGSEEVRDSSGKVGLSKDVVTSIEKNISNNAEFCYVSLRLSESGIISSAVLYGAYDDAFRKWQCLKNGFLSGVGLRSRLPVASRPEFSFDRLRHPRGRMNDIDAALVELIYHPVVRAGDSLSVARERLTQYFLPIGGEK